MRRRRRRRDCRLPPPEIPKERPSMRYSRNSGERNPCLFVLVERSKRPDHRGQVPGSSPSASDDGSRACLLREALPREGF